MEFSRGMRPPTEWEIAEYGIRETWRVYDTQDNHVFCYLSPIRCGEITASDAIAEVMRDYAGDWPEISAELIRHKNA